MAVTDHTNNLEFLSASDLLASYGYGVRYWKHGVKITLLDPEVGEGLVLSGFVPRQHGNPDMCHSNGRLAVLTRSGKPGEYVWTVTRLLASGGRGGGDIKSTAEVEALISWVSMDVTTFTGGPPKS
jgi:hypothetical protein